MSDNPDRIIGELYRNVTNYNEGEVINILVFGPTGVGKSTWINAIINYLKFDTLQQAMEVCLFVRLIDSLMHVACCFESVFWKDIMK